MRAYLPNMLQLPVTANVVPDSPIIFTLMMDAISSSETSILTGATQSHITDHNILHVCKISGFHGNDYEEWRLLGCYAVWLL
jgi:hypothetical protein